MAPGKSAQLAKNLDPEAIVTGGDHRSPARREKRRRCDLSAAELTGSSQVRRTSPPATARFGAMAPAPAGGSSGRRRSLATGGVSPTDRRTRAAGNRRRRSPPPVRIRRAREGHHSAGQTVAGVAGGLRRAVVGAGVQDDGLAGYLGEGGVAGDLQVALAVRS